MNGRLSTTGPLVLLCALKGVSRYDWGGIQSHFVSHGFQEPQAPPLLEGQLCGISPSSLEPWEGLEELIRGSMESQPRGYLGAHPMGVMGLQVALAWWARDGVTRATSWPQTGEGAEGQHTAKYCKDRDQGVGPGPASTRPSHLLCPKPLEPPLYVGPPLEPRWVLQVLLIISLEQSGCSEQLSEGGEWMKKAVAPSRPS